MNTRQTKAQQTRAKIVAAAEKLISENGFDAVQVLDITREAGVGKGTFYTYFKRKEDVASEIAHTRFESIHESSAQQEADICTRITSFLTGSMDYIKQTGIRIAQQWVRGAADPQNPDGEQKLSYDRGVIRGLLDGAVNSGELRPNTPVDRLTDWITTQYYGIVFCWALTDAKDDPTRGMEAFCQGLLREYLKPFLT